MELSKESAGGGRKMTDYKGYAYSGPPFQKIPATSKSTGLSMYFLRRGVKDGSIPHIKSGNDYLINMNRLLEILDALPADRG